MPLAKPCHLAVTAGPPRPPWLAHRLLRPTAPSSHPAVEDRPLASASATSIWHSRLAAPSPPPQRVPASVNYRSALCLTPSDECQQPAATTPLLSSHQHTDSTHLTTPRRAVHNSSQHGFATGRPPTAPATYRCNPLPPQAHTPTPSPELLDSTCWWCGDCGLYHPGRGSLQQAQPETSLSLAAQCVKMQRSTWYYLKGEVTGYLFCGPSAREAHAIGLLKAWGCADGTRGRALC